jgi:hypothetical protein
LAKENAGAAKVDREMEKFSSASGAAQRTAMIRGMNIILVQMKDVKPSSAKKCSKELNSTTTRNCREPS